MDFILDIVIPKEEIESINLKEQLLEWGEEFFSHNPPKYISDSSLVFEQIADLSYYSRLLGKDLDENRFMALTLKGESLSDLERDINMENETAADNELLEFLSELISVEEFYLLLLREDEGIKHTYTVKTKEELSDIVRSSLSRTAPNDILIIKEKL